jgi:hypothetical protein
MVVVSLSSSPHCSHHSIFIHPTSSDLWSWEWVVVVLVWCWHRRSTCYPPHKQLLIGLGAGGGSSHLLWFIRLRPGGRGSGGMCMGRGALVVNPLWSGIGWLVCFVVVLGCGPFCVSSHHVLWWCLGMGCLMLVFIVIQELQF